MKALRPVLFDLDGTLLDTAQDMAYAVNLLREQHSLIELPFATIRPSVSLGAKALVMLGLNIAESDPTFQQNVEDFLAYYKTHATKATRPFQGMESVLTFLEENQIPWGIVTNKPEHFTMDILTSLKLDKRAGCIVCGDSLAKRKPDPDQILHATQLLGLKANECLYIGDSIVDVKAAKAAGMPCLVALYGYIETNQDPYTWGADGYIQKSEEIITWLKANPI